MALLKVTISISIITSYKSLPKNKKHPDSNKMIYQYNETSANVTLCLS